MGLTDKGVRDSFRVRFLQRGESFLGAKVVKEAAASTLSEQSVLEDDAEILDDESLAVGENPWEMSRGSDELFS